MSVLLTDEGRRALAVASAAADPGSLATATTLRKEFSPELAAAAADQASLRKRAVAKFGERAADLYFTRDGLEQATRPAVAAWRAQRFAAAGVTRVLDLGCGIGADSLAFIDAGMDVVAVEIDPLTADYAQANLPGAEVIVGDVEELADSLLARFADDLAATAIYIDPARRGAHGRTWNVADFVPSWDLVLRLLESGHPICVKLGPGLPREIIPDGVATIFVSERGDVVEAGLWRGLGGEGSSSALLLPAGDQITATGRTLEVRAPGRFLHEPDGAVIRAQAVTDVFDEAWLLAPEVAYLSTDDPVVSPLATTFEVLDVLPYDEKALRVWVREHQIGTLEIKKRAIDVDPAQLRRSLKPKGPNAATFVLTRSVDGTRALVVRRLA